MRRVTAAMCAAGRTVAEPRLSPDGASVAFLATEGGKARIVVVDLAGGPERVVTTDPAPLPSRAYGGGAFDWTPDGAALVYAGSGGGLWHQPVRGGPPRQVVAGDAIASPAVSPTGDRVAYVVDSRDVAVVDLDGGSWPVKVSTGADFALDPSWAPDGERMAWLEWDVPAMPWDSSRVVVVEAQASGLGGAKPVTVAGGDGVQVAQPRFSPSGNRLAYLSDETGWLNVHVLDLESGDGRALGEPHEHGSPTWGAGQRSFAWSPDGTALAVARNEGGFGRLVVWAGDDVADVGKGVHGGLSWVGDRLVAVRSGARTPTEVVVYDAASSPTPARRAIALGPVAGWDAAGLAEPALVSWPADDGSEIPGRLYRPAQVELGEPPPLIAWVHGGPTDQWGVEFRPRIAFWVDRGWSVLLPDHRGSTGHGRAFTQAMAGRWGELDVSDVASGLRAAGDRGWGDPRRLVVMGGSAGGFTVLNLLASHPDLCAAGVDLFGVGDLFGLDETTHRFEAHYLHSVVGPLPDAAEHYRKRSPVHRAELITAPLLILQGSDDPVVPASQSLAIADRLRALGRVVELHVYEGEGHGWGRPETVIDELERTESFLRRHVLQWRTHS